MIRILAISFFLIIFSISVHAQEQNRKWAVKHSPQHFIFSTIRLEVERVITDQQFSVTIAPYAIVGDVWEDHPDDDIMGVGAEISGRLYFVNNNKNLKGFYASYGFNYTYFKNLTRQNDWRTVEEDGLEMIKFGLVERDVEIHRVGMVFLAGHQFNLKNVLIIDVYSGFGLKKSYSPQKDFGIKSYDNHFLDHAYSGLDPRIGVKFGFVL